VENMVSSSPRCKSNMRSLGILRIVERQFRIDV
jgi:hypothetical protein